jgi:hypothetical protein
VNDTIFGVFTALFILGLLLAVLTLLVQSRRISGAGWANRVAGGGAAVRLSLVCATSAGAVLVGLYSIASQAQEAAANSHVVPLLSPWNTRYIVLLLSALVLVGNGMVAVAGRNARPIVLVAFACFVSVSAYVLRACFVAIDLLVNLGYGGSGPWG